MTITYELGNSLYVNITNRCSNACTFCVRLEHDGVNGKDSLWLDREPTIDEIKADFETRNLENYNAVVFCGYGEPMERADVVIEIAKWLKAKMPELPIRINTNGQANLIYNRDITPELCGIIDCISISLNAENAQKYHDMAKQELAIARALQDDEFAEPDTIEVVETYKRLNMQAAAEEIFETAKKLTNPTIDFILAVEQIINEQ